MIPVRLFHIYAILFTVYSVIFNLENIYPIIIVGWIYHWLVGSIITHRYITHRAYEVNKFIHNLFISISTLSTLSSPLGWASSHILHHQHSDEKGDPHSPRFIPYLKMLFIGFIYNAKKDRDTSLEFLLCNRYLVDDPYLRWCHRHFYKINTIFLGLLLVVSLLTPYDLFNYFSIITGYHLFGLSLTTYHLHKPGVFGNYAPYKVNGTSQNNWYMTFLTHGEAYHNNHHNNPKSTSNAEKWYEFDLNNLLIRLIKK